MRRLQEKGVSTTTVLYYQSLAVFPAFVLLIFTFRTEYIDFILSNQFVLLAIIAQPLLWIVQESIGIFVLGSVSNLSFLNAFNGIIGLPIFLIIGVVVNGDTPNASILLALSILILALVIKPTLHPVNTRKLFQQGTWFIISISAARMILDGVNVGMFRFILQSINATLFVVALICFLICLPIYLWFLIHPIPQQQKNIAVAYPQWTYMIALFWLLASIPEGYAFAAIPIYTIVTIQAITFVIDVMSDIHNHRIHLNLRTVIFIVLVLVSTMLAIWSLQ